MVRCPDLPTLSTWQSKLEKDGTMTKGNFLVIYGELQGQYIECAIRMDCLIEASKGTAKEAQSPSCQANPTREEAK